MNTIHDVHESLELDRVVSGVCKTLFNVPSDSG